MISLAFIVPLTSSLKPPVAVLPIPILPLLSYILLSPIDVNPVNPVNFGI